MNKQEILQLLSELENKVEIAYYVLVNNGWIKIDNPVYLTEKMPVDVYEIMPSEDEFIYLKTKELGVRNTVVIYKYAQVEGELNEE